ncbi:MAG TPA: glycosyltransferase [Stellaceae bacterium]|nr:glycosyltransferase [Stellaceae bacterium]
MELEQGASLTVELCELKTVDGSWIVERLAPECPEEIECSEYTPEAARWGDQSFSRSKSLGNILSLVSTAEPASLRLPEPVTLLASVYRGSTYLRPFFTSLLTNTSSPHSVVVIDNGNDDPKIIAYLRALAAAHDNITLVRVEHNRGYVGAMCLAIEYAPPDRHVVVLNTDTVLPPNWLERLVGPIFEDPTIASTTPFTNAGTSASFPFLGVDNPLYLGLPVETIDAALARVDGKECRIDLPSGVGFCMAHNRAAIDRIGWYDREAFGKGYGEENDWCLRAARAGFRNVLVPNLFVYHKHGGIYQDEKLALLQKSLSVVQERYPEYEAEVAAFFRADPIGPIRDLVAFMLAARNTRGRAILLFDHELTGGSHVFSSKLVDDLTADGHAIIRASWSDRDPSVRVTVLAGGVQRVFRRSSLDDALALARLVELDEVIVNQLAELPEVESGLSKIVEFVETRGAAVTVYLHDYFIVCPSLNLLNSEDRYCGLPDIEVCDRCAVGNPHFRLDPAAQKQFSMRRWRELFGRLAALTRTFVCFSREGATRLAQVYAIAPERIKVIPHFADHFAAPAGFAVADEPGVRIAVVGAVHEAKGARIVESLAAAIEARGDPAISLVVIGTIDRAEKLHGATVTGRYLSEQLAAEITRQRVNLVLVPSIWPETFCYVAEEAMCLGLPLAVFDIGAPAERVRLYAKGKVLPLCSGEQLLDELLCFAAEQRRQNAAAPGISEVSVTAWGALAEHPTAAPGDGDGAIDGAIEAVDARGILGWAAWSEETGDPLLVEAFVDGQLRGLAWADRSLTGPMPDGRSAAWYGFSIVPAPPLDDAEVPRLEVYATAASGARARLAVPGRSSTG